MRTRLLVLLAAMATALLGVVTPASPSPAAVHKIGYDHYSVTVDGQRIFLWSGEFHYTRLPSPGLWRDVLQKMKSGGFNAVSIYFDWGYHSPAPGVYDFSGVRDIDKLLSIANEVGIYVIARPGPYINAESSGGGFPAWLTTQQGQARTSAPDYLASAKEWLKAVDAVIARHQVTTGTGSVLLYQVENELYHPEQKAYVQALIDQVRADGITVPTTENMPTFATGTGSPDIPGTYDQYPQAGCSGDQSLGDPPTLTRPRPDVPLATWEYGSGWFDPWGGKGYAACYAQTGVGYENVFYKNLIAQGETAVNFYMTYGGTSWGNVGDPSVVYSSYDYGAPIDESRNLTPKYAEMKRIGYLTQAVAPLAKTDPATPPSAPSNSAIHEDLAQNPDTRTQFATLRHNSVNASTKDTTTIAFGGYAKVPQQGAITIDGHDSKLLVANYALGDAKLMYSTSEILTHTQNAAVLYGGNGESGETVLRYASKPTVTVNSGNVTQNWDAATGDLRLNYTHSDTAPIRVRINGTLDLALVSDAGAAEYSIVGGVLVRGPELVRTASVSGDTVALTGDSNVPSDLEVFAPGASKVTWNGAAMSATRTASGTLLAALPGLGARPLVGNGQRCVDVTGNSTKDGTGLELWNCNGGANQSWNLGADGTIRALGKCMDVTGSATTPGTKVDLLTCNGGAAQQWLARNDGELINPNSGLCLDANGAASDPGTALIVWTCTGNVNQIWRPAQSVGDLPALNFRYQAENPESSPSYNDSSWVKATHQTTNNPSKPGTLPVLYADDYGFHEGSVWYRGHFTATGSESSVNLGVVTGNGGAYQVWLNGHYLGGGSPTSTTGTGGVGAPASVTLPVPASSLVKGGDNVLSVLTVNNAHTEDWNFGSVVDTFKEPRGLTAAKITGLTGAISWSLKGNSGNDAVRGWKNDGGLTGQRDGWALPAFQDSSWPSVTLPNNDQRPGVSWYRSTFSLAVPQGHDAPLAVRFDDSPSKHYQALLFVNGWNMGHYDNDLGPEHVFPVPAGILNPNGANTIAIAVVSLDAGGDGLGSVSLQPVADHSGGA